MQLKTIILLISGFVCLIIIGGLTMSYTEKLGLTLPTDVDRVNRAAHIQMLEEIDEKVQSDLGITSIKRFGAVGDGVINDTQAFLDAFTFLRNNNGGNLFVPEGTYMINQTLKTPSNVTIQGAGIDKTILKAIPDTAFPAVKFHVSMPDERDYASLITTDSVGGVGITTNIKIKGLTIDWSNCPIGANSTAPLWIDSAEKVIVEEVKIINAMPSNYPTSPLDSFMQRSEGIQTTQSKHVIINKCRVSTTGYRCISIGAGSFDVVCTENIIEGANPWRHLLEIWEWWKANIITEWVRISKNTFIITGGGVHDCMSIHGAGKIIITNNTFKIESPSSNFAQGIKIFDGAYDITVAHNLFDLDTGQGEYSSAIAMEAHTSNASHQANKNIVITSNQIYMKLTAGEFARQSRRCPVIGGSATRHENVTVANNNIVLDIPTGINYSAIRFKAKNLSISGNVIKFLGAQSGLAEGPSGIYIIGSEKASIIGNSVLGAFDYGLRISNSINVSIIGNILDGALTKPLSQHTNTNLKIAHNIGEVTHNE